MQKFDNKDIEVNQYSILVVDNNPNNLELLNRYLGNKGYSVTITTTGQEALAINDIERFDLILLDIFMPDLDGFEVLKQLKKKASTCNIPVVMLTASNDSEHMNKANELLADDFIIKSESLKSVRERILCVLQKHKTIGAEIIEPPKTNIDNKKKSTRLLVVDDDELSRDLLSRRIKKFGYDVDTAQSGQAALDLLNKQQYDLVFLDVMMPVISGIDVLEKIKSNETTSSTSVVMVSSSNDDDIIMKCTNLGARDYVVKPYHFTQLKNTIETTIHN